MLADPNATGFTINGLQAGYKEDTKIKLKNGKEITIEKFKAFNETKKYDLKDMREIKRYNKINLLKRLNNEYRNIDKETDVLSFPMFEKTEIPEMKKCQYEEALGDIVISIERVKEQAVEYGHSFERELAYMIVHGFYHLMGEDHIEENDKLIMREKEEEILKIVFENKN